MANRVSPSPLVTIVMPLYNGKAYLGESVDSVLRQTYSNFELVVVDDGSTDGSPEIVRAYADPRIRLVLQPNAGTSAARNRGVREAKGEYIALLDADDNMDPEKLAKQVAFLEAHPEIGVVGSDFKFIGDATHRVRFPQGHDEIFAAMLFECCMANSAAMMRREILPNPLYSGEFRITEDYDLWVRLLERGVRFANIPEPLVDYRLHVDQKSGGPRRELEQREANAIRTRWLRRIGVEPTEDELSLHLAIAGFDWEPEKAFLLSVERWLDRILKQNGNAQFLPKVGLRTFASNRWRSACVAALPMGGWVAYLVASSGVLSVKERLSKSQLKLMAKAIFNSFAHLPSGAAK